MAPHEFQVCPYEIVRAISKNNILEEISVASDVDAMMLYAGIGHNCQG
jgi:hypothetical protein